MNNRMNNRIYRYNLIINHTCSSVFLLYNDNNDNRILNKNSKNKIWKTKHTSVNLKTLIEIVFWSLYYSCNILHNRLGQHLMMTQQNKRIFKSYLYDTIVVTFNTLFYIIWNSCTFLWILLSKNIGNHKTLLIFLKLQ